VLCRDCIGVIHHDAPWDVTCGSDICIYCDRICKILVSTGTFNEAGTSYQTCGHDKYANVCFSFIKRECNVLCLFIGRRDFTRLKSCDFYRRTLHQATSVKGWCTERFLRTHSSVSLLLALRASVVLLKNKTPSCLTIHDYARALLDQLLSKEWRADTSLFIDTEVAEQQECCCTR